MAALLQNATLLVAVAKRTRIDWWMRGLEPAIECAWIDFQRASRLLVAALVSSERSLHHLPLGGTHVVAVIVEPDLELARRSSMDR